MDTIKRELTSEKPELIAERDSRSVVRAVVDLLKKGLNEQVHPVSIVWTGLQLPLLWTNQIIFICDHLHPLLISK